MSWLNPSILYWAALALVPVLLHLLFRQRVQKVAFSAVRFLRKHSRELVLRKRWLEWLVTGLRVLCILLLVAAFARPFFAERSAASGGRETLIIFDLSRSMTFGSRFADAQKEALKIISAADPSARVSVLTFSDAGSATVTETANAADAAALIKRLSPGGGATDILAALDSAVQHVTNGHRSGDVFLISDLQSSALVKTRESRRLPKGCTFHVIGVAGKVDPAALNSIAVQGGACSTDLTPGDNNFAVSARVFNRGPAREVTATCSVANKPLSTKRLLLPQNGEAIVTLTGTLRELGEHAGEVAVSGAAAALKGDERFHFVVRVVNKLAVAVINGKPSRTPAQDAAYFLIKALNAGEDSPFNAQSFEKLPPLEKFDAVILSEVSALPPGDVQRLEAFVHAGGALIIGVGPGIVAETFNNSLGTIAPARLRQWHAPTRELFLIATDTRHPLTVRLVSEGKGDLSAPRFKGAWGLKDSQDAVTPLRFNDGRPALVESHPGRAGSGVLLFASSLDLFAGDFPLRAIFLPFIRESVKLLCARGEQTRSLAVGESLALPPGTTLTRPDGSAFTAEPGRESAAPLTDPGVYTLTHAGKVERYAVNADPRESDLSAADAASIEKLIEPVPEVTLRRSGNILERVVQTADRAAAESRVSLGWWCLTVLLLCSLIELWVAQIASKQ